MVQRFSESRFRLVQLIIASRLVSIISVITKF